MVDLMLEVVMNLELSLLVLLLCGQEGARVVSAVVVYAELLLALEVVAGVLLKLM